MQEFILHYLIPAFLFLLGVGFSVMAAIKKIHQNLPSFSKKEVYSTFFNQEGDNLMISILVFFVMLVAIYLCRSNGYTFKHWLIMPGIALFSGWAGHRIAYAVLQTTEQVLIKKIEACAHERISQKDSIH